MYFPYKMSQIAISVKSKQLKVNSIELVEPLSHFFVQ